MVDGNAIESEIRESGIRIGELTSPEISRSAIKQGHDLLLQGFTVSRVVHDYGDVYQGITELALALDAPVGTEGFRTLTDALTMPSRAG